MSIVGAAGLAAWMLEALALGYFMRRRGYDGYTWVSLGTVLGPIAVVVAVTFVVRPASRQPTLIHSGRRGSEGIDVLIGVDGSPNGDAAVACIASLLGRPLGRVTLGYVVPLAAGAEPERIAKAQLEGTRSHHASLDPSTVLLRGAPSEALQDYAVRQGYKLLVVGTRGDGRSRALLGSVAVDLAGGSSVPVLLVDDSAADAAA
jgi:nucleotide-binding universal stress UspA family protein